ncbi:AMP-binding protein [Mycobacterium saskatchewanense]|uniref:AMP-binding protein n=1 Tax=Mycobacterium saskatchewanense TaxID=220927 RepID=UPI00114D5337|nr:AMP-binding protein [Mycobacterium saskatchewanense]
MTTTESMPPREETVIRYLLERNAAEAPDDKCVAFENGTEWSRLGCLGAAYASANQLHTAGVRQGDRVGVFLPNGESFIRAWWGLCVLGATIVPINPVFRGTMLERVLELADLSAIVVDAERRTLIQEQPRAPRVVLDAGELGGFDRTAPGLQRPIEPWDSVALIMTSGTTGPSKLVTVTYMYFATGAGAFYEREGLGRTDVFLIDLPMFHMAALCYIGGSLLTRSGLAIRDRPALDRYWEIARDVGATAAILLSTMVTFLINAERRPAEREHRLRTVLMSPLPGDPQAFKDRFGIANIWTTFGMSEAPSVMRGACGVPGSDQPGYVGQPYSGYEARLVDENDVEVPVGSPGELMIRTHTPWVISPGYFGDPEATAKAWRNGWFHTGDVMRRNEYGSFFFVDRVKDALRRRGEMISAYEVERVVLRYPGIREAACVAYPSDGGAEDDVKVFVVSTGGQPDFCELLRFCHANMPHYMVPRYFESIAVLPKTATMRVTKNVLRDQGNSARTWDREQQGIRVTRRGIEGLPTASPGVSQASSAAS